PATAPTPSPTPAAPARDDRKASKQARAKLAETTRPLRIELQRIDERLARLATEKAEVEALLAAPAGAGEDFAELGRRLHHVAAETAMLEERWLELQTELEALGAAS
nr:ABC transporter [Rubrivivax sp.]